MKLLFTLISHNKKTGPIPVSTSSKDTCPDACAFKKQGCYAKGGALNIHWSRLTRGESGLSWESFLASVKSLRMGTLWRHNQAGDLAGEGNGIDTVKLSELTEANKGKRVICYTHKPVLDSQAPEASANREAIASAIKNGFNINLSANSLSHADELLALNLAPVCTVVPSAQITNCKTPQGARVVICPAAIRENVSCATCTLCSRARGYVIGFPAHGYAKNAVSQVARGEVAA